jgi:hypothetical protein
MGGGAWRRKLSGTVIPNFKISAETDPLGPLGLAGWLALAGGNEAAGRGQFWRDTHEIKSCVPPKSLGPPHPLIIHLLPLPVPCVQSLYVLLPQLDSIERQFTDTCPVVASCERLERLASLLARPRQNLNKILSDPPFNFRPSLLLGDPQRVQFLA